MSSRSNQAELSSLDTPEPGVYMIKLIRNDFVFSIFGVVLILVLMLAYYKTEYSSTSTEVPPTVVSHTAKTTVQLSTRESMEICGNKLSDGRKDILADQIDRITAKYLPRTEHRQAFVGLLCIESKFNSDAKSSVGAVGIAQIMPKYGTYFAKTCDLGNVDAQDLQDTEVNLTIGACHFAHLLDALDGNIALALSGYNSGQDSETTKRLAKLAEGHPETMGYVSKFYSYLNKVQIASERKQEDVRASIPNNK